MLIVDDILLSPIRGILWIFREIHDAAQQELEGETETITTALSELYMMLETKRITEQEFDEREKVLLDRLDKIQENVIYFEDEEEVENEEPTEDMETTESEE